MKKILLFFLLLTGCAGFKATNLHTNSAKEQEQRVYDSLQTQQVKSSFNLLEHQWQQDSVTYKAMIGVSGTGARIWVTGSGQKVSLSQKQQDSSRTDSLATHIQLNQEHKQQEQQTVKNTRQFSLNIYWVLLSIGLLALAVYFVRKYWPKSPG
ncbi:hypothetical protein SAMN05216436_11155 [bacterium A37T11]|nr:hypothetical protein SAMN05216436_11155 [bacterium A37T11]